MNATPSYGFAGTVQPGVTEPPGYMGPQSGGAHVAQWSDEEDEEGRATEHGDDASDDDTSQYEYVEDEGHRWRLLKNESNATGYKFVFFNKDHPGMFKAHPIDAKGNYKYLGGKFETAQAAALAIAKYAATLPSPEESEEEEEEDEEEEEFEGEGEEEEGEDEDEGEGEGEDEDEGEGEGEEVEHVDRGELRSSDDEFEEDDQDQGPDAEFKGVELELSPTAKSGYAHVCMEQRHTKPRYVAHINKGGEGDMYLGCWPSLKEAARHVALYKHGLWTRSENFSRLPLEKRPGATAPRIPAYTVLLDDNADASCWTAATLEAMERWYMQRVWPHLPAEEKADFKKAIGKIQAALDKKRPAAAAAPPAPSPRSKDPKFEVGDVVKIKQGLGVVHRNHSGQQGVVAGPKNKSGYPVEFNEDEIKNIKPRYMTLVSRLPAEKRRPGAAPAPGPSSSRAQRKAKRVAADRVQKQAAVFARGHNQDTAASEDKLSKRKHEEYRKKQMETAIPDLAAPQQQQASSSTGSAKRRKISFQQTFTVQMPTDEVAQPPAQMGIPVPGPAASELRRSRDRNRAPTVSDNSMEELDAAVKQLPTEPSTASTAFNKAYGKINLANIAKGVFPSKDNQAEWKQQALGAIATDYTTQRNNLGMVVGEVRKRIDQARKFEAEAKQLRQSCAQMITTGRDNVQQMMVDYIDSAEGVQQ